MTQPDVDLDEFSELLKQKSRHESDKARKLKRKIEDNTTIQNELTQEEYELLQTSLQHEIDQLEMLAAKSKEFVESKLDETNT